MNSDSTSNWKEKAIQRQVELKNMRKRIKEVRNSRENWKLKSKENLSKIKVLENELNQIKKNLAKIISQ